MKLKREKIGLFKVCKVRKVRVQEFQILQNTRKHLDRKKRAMRWELRSY